MSFLAEYHGECEACGNEVKGQECTFTSDHRIMHVRCPDNRFDPPGGIPLCGQCFTYHNGECL